MPPDNAATVVPNTDVSFPQDGPNSIGITRISNSLFNLANIGTYLVYFRVCLFLLIIYVKIFLNLLLAI